MNERFMMAYFNQRQDSKEMIELEVDDEEAADAVHDINQKCLLPGAGFTGAKKNDFKRVVSEYKMGDNGNRLSSSNLLSRSTMT
jgi:hypothetical protein